VVIITPLIKRAHRFKIAGQIVFVDSTSACDAENHYNSFMMTPCAASAVSLAIIITKCI
jgi:hypothetical protein